MGVAPAWTERWRVVAPAGAVRVDVDLRGRPAGAARPGLAPGTPVALCASGLVARRRVRRAASRAGIQVDREYVALPSAASPAFLVEDGTAALDYFRTRILAAPPGMTTLAGVAEVAIRALRVLPVAVLSALAPGRVAIGRQA